MDENNPLTVLYTGPREFSPAYQTEHAAGVDLRAHLPEERTIMPGERVLVPTGIRLAIPPGWEGQVRPRSGLAWKKGLTLLNAPGTIDADYRGEIKVVLINLGREEVALSRGMRIAQLVIAPVSRAKFQHAEELPESSRGSGGFGSTGI